jgi:hypothetical protein
MSESKKDRPLPKPPKIPFGRQRPDENVEDQGSLLADRLATAMAQGRLEEFLKNEMPDNEYARNLASMMMGMTGMMPIGSQSAPRSPEQTDASQPRRSGDAGPAGDVPEEVRAAAQSGDVKGLMDLLRQEQKKRMPGAEPGPEEETAAPRPGEQPAIDKDVIDALIRIASDNSVTLDWLILRAIKVYVQEYQKTGRL